MDYETTGIDTNIDTNDLPIQIGCVFTDSEFKVIKEYSSYIKWFKIDGIRSWNENLLWKEAYDIHKIPLSKLKNGKDRDEIIIDLIENQLLFLMHQILKCFGPNIFLKHVRKNFRFIIMHGVFIQH